MNIVLLQHLAARACVKAAGSTNERIAPGNDQPIGNRTGCTLQQSNLQNSSLWFPKIKVCLLFLSIFGSCRVNVSWLIPNAVQTFFWQQQRRKTDYQNICYHMYTVCTIHCCVGVLCMYIRVFHNCKCSTKR